MEMDNIKHEKAWRTEFRSHIFKNRALSWEGLQA